MSDGTQRAHVFHISADNFEAAWQTGVQRLQGAYERDRAQSGNIVERSWIRVECAINVTAITWAELNARFKRHKRNYFRRGIAFDAALHIAITEQELNANAILYGGNAINHATFNAGNFSVYAKRRFTGLNTADLIATLEPETPVFLFDTKGVFCAEDGVPHPLNPGPTETGWRTLAALEPGMVKASIISAASYLSTQVQGGGQFVYGYFPCFDRAIKNYNTLRHASTTYSMIEAWALTGDEALKSAIDRSLAYLTQELIKSYVLPDGSVAAYLLDTGDEIKLGGNAVCLLALVKYSEVTGTRHYLPVLEALANGMAWMQDATTGAFVHVLHGRDLTVKEAFR
ncbi:MAG: UDP-N-acetylmuramoyl-tripeptide--D-alanyl-D-alanine ligase, partial [Pseudomonas sp.]